MPRLSIDVTPQQHQKLKAIAALSGQSLKDFVLSRTIDDGPNISGMSQNQALQALTEFLKPRLDQVKNGETTDIPKGQLAAQIKKRYAERHAAS